MYQQQPVAMSITSQPSGPAESAVTGPIVAQRHAERSKRRAPLRTSISQVELRRRAWHMLPGLLPFLLPLIPHGERLSALDLTALCVYATIPTAIIVWKYRTIARPGERSWVAGVVGYPATVIGTLLLFPSRWEFAAVVLAVLAFGDGSATLGGLMFGKRRLPWNPGKSWIGLGCFVVIASPFAMLAYWWVAKPAVPFGLAAGCGIVAACLGAAAETLPSRINDNIRVGLAAAAGVVAANALLTGGL